MHIKKLNHFDNYFWPKDPRPAISHTLHVQTKKETGCRGSKFLPNTGVADLKRAYKKETDPRRRDRLLAYVQRKDGVPLDRIGRMLGRPKSTISAWLNRAQEEGMRARFERSGRGRKRLIDRPQTRQLAADLDAGPESCGFESSLWDSNLARLHIRRKFGVQYSKAGVLQLIREMGFSWSRARPKNPKSASKRKQKEFQERAKKPVAEKSAQGYAVLAGDASSIQKAPDRPGYGWRRRGKRATSPPSVLSRKRRYIFGVLSASAFYFMFYEKPDSDSFCSFLERVHKRFGRVLLLFVDNASYHKSKKVKKFLERYNGEIVLEYLLPYTPELNPIEMQWRVIKRVLSAKVFGTLDEMEQSVRKLFARKEILPVKMFNYLIC